jgi:hypothetical protein
MEPSAMSLGNCVTASSHQRSVPSRLMKHLDTE